MVPASATREAAYKPGGLSGSEQKIVAMFVDLRGSTTLGERRMPYDVIFILNQFSRRYREPCLPPEAISHNSLATACWRCTVLKGDFQRGCRDALVGAAKILDRLVVLNKRLEDELDEPLRIGIGIHAGECIVGIMGPPTAPILSAIGDNINIAARLEAKAKVFECNIIVSSDTVRHAGLIPDPATEHLVDVRGREGEVAVLALNSLNDIPGFYNI